MQYADIALAVKTAQRQETFTYRIPPQFLADIHIGQRVEVPFYRRKLLGTIVSLRATPPKIKGSIKEIANLVEPFPIYDTQMLQLARQVAQKYGATLGQVLDMAAPKPAKRTAKKSTIQPVLSRTNPERQQAFGLYEPRDKRFDDYLKLIARAIAADKRALILFPDQNMAEQFKLFLAKQGTESLVIPPSVELILHYQAWLDCLSGQASVIIGTRKAIFAPIPQLRLIVIDTPSEYGYKEEQFPYYSAVSVAKLRAQLIGAHLVLGDSFPRLEEWQEEKQNRLVLLPSAWTENRITLIDTTTHRGLLSEVLLEHMRATISAGGQIIFFYNRKGSGRYYRCLECETAIYCPRCDTLLTVHEESGKTILRCSQCQYQTLPPYRCEVCSSYKLGTVGLGVDSIANLLQEQFPHQRIIVPTTAELMQQPFNIAVATHSFFYFPSIKSFDLVVAAQTDQLLHGSQWNRNEQAFLTLGHLLERAKHLLVLSSEPEHPVIRALCAKNPEFLYPAELAERTTFGYPPAAPVIRLQVSGSDKEQVKQSAETVYQKYLGLLPEAEQRVFPPSPVGTGKKRDKYRYQIIIKSQLTRLILDNLPTDWQIDPEPTEL